MSIKGHNSVKILQRNDGQILQRNDEQDLVDVDVHTKFCQILSIGSQDIERKRNSVINEGSSKGNNSSAHLGKVTCIYT